MLRIIGRMQSINVRKVLWTCDEIGISYALQERGAGLGKIPESAFLALNPKALVPVVIDGDVVLTESNTIVRYLAAWHHRVDLLPEGALARARVEEMMDWQATEFNAAWRPAFQAFVRKRSTLGGAAEVQNSLAAWTAMLGLLERRLAGPTPYVCGEAFTVADIVVGLSVNRWFQAPIERPDFPAVRAYFARLVARPAARPYLGGETD